jgi:hypothetical protein
MAKNKTVLQPNVLTGWPAIVKIFGAARRQGTMGEGSYAS